MRDKITENIRKIRKEIKSENNADWDQLEYFFIKMQRSHKKDI